MKMRILSLLLAAVFLSQFSTVHAAAAEDLLISVVAEKNSVNPGDIVNFSVKLGPHTNLLGLRLELNIPEGMEFVSGSGKAANNIRETLHATYADFTENSSAKTYIFLADPNPYTGYQWIELFTFQCRVKQSAQGSMEVGLKPDDGSNYNQLDNQRVVFSPATLYVNASYSQCTVSFFSNYGTGGISPVTLPRGSTYTLPACTFTPPSGRQFRAWSVNGMEKYPGETIVVQSDITISAIWQDIPGTPVTQIYSVTAQAGAGGSISPAGISNVLQYSDITYTITPESGYEISDVIVDGVNIGLTASYTFERVTTNHSITAVFEKKETPPAVPIYTDVLSSAWYYGDVQFVTERGLMNGVGEGLFAPDTLTDRAMIVTVLWRMEGSPIQKTSADFFDVSDGMWYTDAVRWASANGIVNGYGNSLFGPTDKITREQVMAILHRYAAYKGKTDGTILPMLEAYTYSPWAEGDVFWAENNGLLNNMGIRVNNMTEKASRGEIAAYLHRFCLLLDES